MEQAPKRKLVNTKNPQRDHHQYNKSLTSDTRAPKKKKLVCLYKLTNNPPPHKIVQGKNQIESEAGCVFAASSVKANRRGVIPR